MKDIFNGLKIPLLIVMVLLMSRCNKNNEANEKVDFIEITDAIDSLVRYSADSMILNKFNFSNLVPLSYDSVIIVRPYVDLSEVKSLGLVNFNKIEQALENINYSETKCALLFVRNKKIVAYTVVPLKPINFTDLHEEIPIIKASESKTLLLKYQRYKDDRYYVIVK